jgi:hypothetical protein
MNHSSLSPAKVAIILLTIAAAGIHFSLLFPDPIFILNGLGFLALLAAYFLPLPFAKDNRSLVKWAFMGYTAVTVLAWIAIGEKSWPLGMMGYLTKLIEIALMVLLWRDKPAK